MNEGNRPNGPAVYSYTARCPICQRDLMVRAARGRRSGKPFVTIVCPEDGRHFRAFINHEPFVREVLTKLEAAS